MNTLDNKRKKDSQVKIEKTFVQLIQTKEINEITVTDICKLTNLNRSTFYANYLDIYDLADKIALKLENDVFSLYSEERENKKNSNNFLKLFTHIRDNQIFYRTYFKLNKDNDIVIKEYDTNLSKLMYDDKYLDYHMEFFKAGFNAIVKKWLMGGCVETPQEINEILISEYRSK